MQALTQWFSSLSFGDPALWVALGSGLAIVLGFLFLGRRPSRHPAFAIALPELTNLGDWDNPPSARHDERRRAIRRNGLPTPVHIIDWKANRKSKPMEAYVLDRSTGGLRLAMEKPSAVGTVLAARPGKRRSSSPGVRGSAELSGGRRLLRARLPVRIRGRTEQAPDVRMSRQARRRVKQEISGRALNRTRWLYPSPRLM